MVRQRPGACVQPGPNCPQLEPTHWNSLAVPSTFTRSSIPHAPASRRICAHCGHYKLPDLRIQFAHSLNASHPCHDRFTDYHSCLLTHCCIDVNYGCQMRTKITRRTSRERALPSSACILIGRYGDQRSALDQHIMN